MDQRRVQRHAHLPDGPVLQGHARAGLLLLGLRPRHVGRRELRFPLPAGLLHSHACLRLPPAPIGSRCRGLGLFVLFFHHHHSRPYMESPDAGFHTAHYRRPRALLSRPFALGRRRHGAFHGFPGAFEPRADDLLLPLRHAVHRRGLRHRCRTPGHVARLAQSHGRRRGCRRAWHSGQLAQPLSHLRIQQRVHPRPGRAEPPARSRAAGAHRRPRPQLHHAVELRP